MLYRFHTFINVHSITVYASGATCGHIVHSRGFFFFYSEAVCFAILLAALQPREIVSVICGGLGMACRFTWDQFTILYNPSIVLRLAGKLGDVS